MQATNLDRDWLFSVQDPLSLRMDEGTPVDLPHDYSVGLRMDPNAHGTASNAYLPGGVIEYHKKLDLPAGRRRYIVEFEGVYHNAVVKLNGNIVGKRPYGYTGFFCDLTGCARCDGGDELVVSVNNSDMPNTRWYSGMGIYRHVRLLYGPDVYVAPWGISVTTPEIRAASDAHGYEAVVAVETTLAFEDGAPTNGLALEQRLLDASGTAVAKHSETVDPAAGGCHPAAAVAAGPAGTAMAAAKAANAAGAAETTGFVSWDTAEAAGFSAWEAEAAGGTPVQIAPIKQRLALAAAELWSPERPYLYTLVTTVSRHGTVLDEQRTRVGVRSVSVNAREGFCLNGVSRKMKGGCVHHDCGPLGAAAYDDAEYRKVALLKQSGFDAVRCAHNPPSPAFLDACDELGLLVIDEAFDCWGVSKMANDYHAHFESEWKRDLAAMLLRDRNHPSVVIWSTGNEIPERDGSSGGYRLARELAAFVRQYDTTRPVTNALCELWEKDGPRDWAALTAPFAEPLDIVGYNYLVDRYEPDGKAYPERVICGTETFPKDAFDYWEATLRHPYVIGDFVWTSLDYLGEAGIGRVKRGAEDSAETQFLGRYPYSHANCGDIDICGDKRPQSYYRDCVWGESKRPYIAVHDPACYGDPGELTRWGWPEVYPVWNWPGREGRPVEIDVYCADEETELLLNGRSLGKKPAGKKSRYLATFTCAYEPGELVAVAYSGGRETGRTALVTAAAPARLVLEADRHYARSKGSADALDSAEPSRAALEARFGALAYIKILAQDAAGNLASQAETSVTLRVEGPARLLALASGDPRSDEPYSAQSRKLYLGRATAVVRADGAEGEVRVCAEAPGLASAQLVIPIRGAGQV
ncbi:MAG: DUF4982 domain-containing protein [Clostridiales bacterium]|jgi:beta-galactosidase|nr:DUF4982 domain-containing protein [Clostridiales bacterium]